MQQRCGMIILSAKRKSWFLRLILFPISWIYGLVLYVRHFMYNVGWKKSVSYNFPIIVVGNLSLGGTGKTPFTAYLCELLLGSYQIATLSRGYKRKSVGFFEVQKDHLPHEVGDEPCWLKMKFPTVSVNIGEDRVLSISYLLQKKPFIDVVILDDAFQHRKLNAKMNIMLTEYANLFVDDDLLPVGYLRDVKYAATRANIIVVSKCPSNISDQQVQESIKEKLNLLPSQELFFSVIVYKKPIPIVENEHVFHTFRHHNVLLVTGIANPQPLIEELTRKQANVTHLKFLDHFEFPYEEVIHIITTFDKMPSPKLVLCTEKDAVKIMRFKKYWKHLPIFTIPVKTKIINNEERFLRIIKNYIDSF